MKEEVAISVERLSKKFIKQNGSEFWALKDVSFKVNKGQVFGIIGRNGAGKSTLLNILSGIIKPTSGQIVANGRITGVLDIGTGFHPDLTGYENVYLNAQMNGLTKQEVNTVLDDLVGFAGLGDFINEPVKIYSNGMYMRLAFSIFAFLKPQILLLDEVFSVGDATFQRKCIRKMQELISSGITIITVAHNMNEMSSICSRLIMLESGRKIKEGTNSEVINSYLERTLSDWDRGVSAFHSNELKFTNLILNNAIQLTSVSIKRTAGKDVSQFIVEDELEIIFTYNKLVTDSIHLILSIFSGDQFQLMTDSPALRNGFLPRKCPMGSYSESVIIPANLLNQGLYFISLGVARNYKVAGNENISLNNILSFKMHLAEWDEDNYWSQRINSPFRPKLEWTFNSK